VLPEVEGATWIELGVDQGRRAVVLVGPVDAVDGAEVPDEIPRPTVAPARLRQEIEQVRTALADTRARLAALARDRTALQRWLRRSEEALRVEEVRAVMPTVGAVVLLRGFVPEGEVGRVRDLAAEHGWGVWVSEVRDPDEAPTLIRTPRWVRPIEPLFRFLGVVPAYGHVDISLPFLVFFSLFFAMIVGDAGYGALFLVLTELGARRARRPPARVIALLRLLALATLVWGLLAGNVFGIEALPSLLAWARLEWLAVDRNVIGLTFAIGAVHLTLAHLWNAVRWLNSVRALAELGWIATTWTMYLLARQQVLGDPVPAIAWPAFGVGLVLIVLFTTPWRRLRRDWFHHAVLPLTLVNNFVDVVSYVRLFAVGAATYAVAGAFNALAADLGLAGPVGGVATALVLFFGHALNVLLAAMGVLVHGVRLNTLEFAGHLHLSWTGHPYRPLAHADAGTGAREGDA
jgi:V/A-type H+-transporting ATPase subunit I